MTTGTLASIPRDGTILRVHDVGSGSPPLIFIHGWSCSHRHFAPQIQHFSVEHRVVAPDQRGHGESDAPHSPIGVDVLADDLTWLCQALSLERPLLVGHSLGGLIALETARRLPEVAGVALLDPALLFAERALPGLHRMVERLTLASWRDAVREFAEQVFFADGDSSDHSERVDELLRTPRRVLHPTFRDMLAFDPEPALRSIDAPVLLLDPPRPVGDRTLLRAALPALTEESIPGVGHFLQLEAPAAVNAALSRFIRGCA
jgi:pimeloyl-ACP methyl ester carboxylesterase